MRQHLLGVLAIATALLAAPSLAQQTEDFEGNYDPTRTYEPNAPAGPSTWHDVMLLPPGEQAPFGAAIRADRRYVGGMRRHHEGAVTMSEAYLRDPASSSPRMRRLARAIIANQRYEIALMDDVARRLEEPVRIVDLGITRLAIRAMATENLGQHWRVLPVPIPGPLDPAGPVSERDVQFAKGMIEHHAAALDMARRYNADPEARNGFLKILNVNIITDQSQEIALMRTTMAAYPGDTDAIAVPPGMVHGMPGMTEGAAAHGTH